MNDAGVPKTPRNHMITATVPSDPSETPNITFWHSELSVLVLQSFEEIKTHGVQACYADFALYTRGLTSTQNHTQNHTQGVRTVRIFEHIVINVLGGTASDLHHRLIERARSMYKKGMGIYIHLCDRQNPGKVEGRPYHHHRVCIHCRARNAYATALRSYKRD